MSECERAQSVEVQKIRALEVPGAIPQARGGHVPEVNRPKAECEDEAMGAQALGRYPRRGGPSSHVLSLPQNSQTQDAGKSAGGGGCSVSLPRMVNSNKGKISGTKGIRNEGSNGS